jgi:hypothetical protein
VFSLAEHRIQLPVEIVLLSCKRSYFEDYMKVIFPKFGKEIIKDAGIDYPEELRKFYTAQRLIPEMNKKLRFAMYVIQEELMLTQPENYLFIV